MSQLYGRLSGFFDESMNAKLAGATACRVELSPISPLHAPFCKH
jgi:hypothetical protein